MDLDSWCLVNNNTQAQCCVPKCYKKNRGGRYKVFPLPTPSENKELIEKWVYAVGGGPDDVKDVFASKKLFACERHYLDLYIDNSESHKKYSELHKNNSEEQKNNSELHKNISEEQKNNSELHKNNSEQLIKNLSVTEPKNVVNEFKAIDTKHVKPVEIRKCGVKKRKVIYPSSDPVYVLQKIKIDGKENPKLLILQPISTGCETNENNVQATTDLKELSHQVSTKDQDAKSKEAKLNLTCTDSLKTPQIRKPIIVKRGTKLAPTGKPLKTEAEIAKPITLRIGKLDTHVKQKQIKYYLNQ